MPGEWAPRGMHLLNLALPACVIPFTILTEIYLEVTDNTILV